MLVPSLVDPLEFLFIDVSDYHFLPFALQKAACHWKSVVTGPSTSFFTYKAVENVHWCICNMVLEKVSFIFGNNGHIWKHSLHANLKSCFMILELVQKKKKTEIWIVNKNKSNVAGTCYLLCSVLCKSHLVMVKWHSQSLGWHMLLENYLVK